MAKMKAVIVEPNSEAEKYILDLLRQAHEATGEGYSVQPWALFGEVGNRYIFSQTMYDTIGEILRAR